MNRALLEMSALLRVPRPSGYLPEVRWAAWEERNDSEHKD